MKVQGVIIDMENKRDVVSIIDSIQWDPYFNELHYEDVELFINKILERENSLDAITSKFMSGQEDAKWFYFSDIEEGVDAISYCFPEFNLVEVDSEDYSLDYNYKKDM